LGFGSVVHDSQGVVFAASSYSVNACVDPILAEALAALHTLEFCRNRSLTSIILEGDSLIVVNAINRPSFNWSLLGNIISNIQGLLYGFHNWKVCYTQ
jgi:ribonuclease HI